MLLNIVNWLYVLATAFLLGMGVCRLSVKAFGYSIRTFDGVLVAGLVTATVYAQIWSLFGGVGLWANLVLLVICLLILLTGRKEVSDKVRSLWSTASRGTIIIGAFLFLLWAFFASRGYFAYDSDLYHGQSIRWIEEYGVVKGLGNLHERFAYNSSCFALSALYSMKFLLGISMHSLGGFWAWILSLGTLPIGRIRKRRKLVLSDMARIAGIYYLTTICDEVVAPASDFPTMCLLLWIVIKWLDLLEEKAGTAPFGLLCVAGAYAVTLKLSAGLILILLIKPARELIRGKKWKEIGIFLLLGLITVIPWMTRTALISGYLLYPFPGLDVLNVDWKMHPQIVEVDAANIKVWARGMYETALLDTPVRDWLPGWFRSQLTGTEKLLVLGAVAGLVITVVLFALNLIRKEEKDWDSVLVLAAMGASYLFWQFSAPMVRYGYAYLLLAAVLPVGYLVCRIPWQKVLILGIALVGIYKACMVGNLAWNSRWTGWVTPMDYGHYQLETYEVSGETIYYNPTGDRVGYDLFPASPGVSYIELRGDDIRDGFRWRD